MKNEKNCVIELEVNISERERAFGLAFGLCAPYWKLGRPYRVKFLSSLPDLGASSVTDQLLWRTLVTGGPASRSYTFTFADSPRHQCVAAHPAFSSDMLSLFGVASIRILQLFELQQQLGMFLFVF